MQRQIDETTAIRNVHTGDSSDIFYFGLHCGEVGNPNGLPESLLVNSVGE